MQVLPLYWTLELSSKDALILHVNKSREGRGPGLQGWVADDVAENM